MKKFLATLLTVCMLLSIIPATMLTTVVAEDVKEFISFDCSTAANITKAKLVAEETIVREGSKFSAKWDFSGEKNVYFTNPEDITDYTHLTFWAYGTEGKSAKFVIFLGSENDSTEGSDYYSFTADIRKEGWNLYTFDLNKIGRGREPRGFDQIDNFRFTTDWGTVSNEEGTVIYIDEVKFTNEAPEVIAPPAKTPAPNKALASLGDGVALLVGNSTAYAKNALTKVDVENTSVVPTIAPGDRTLVPVRFISEGFGADVDWDGDTKTVTVKLDGKVISLVIDSNEIVVDGTAKELDVPAQIIEDRTMIPLRAMAESIGKEVFWDPRGLILITTRVIDASADSDLIEAMLETLKTGKLPEVVSSTGLTESVLERAFRQRPVYFTIFNNLGALGQEQAGSHALFYLCLATNLDPNTKSSTGVLAKDRALQHIRNLISGAKEPFCANGPYPAHAGITNALVMVKNTPAVWDELSADEKAKLDLIMKSFAISSNWGFNDVNNYVTGLDLIGNFNKGWNPNFRAAGLLPILNAVMYFGDAETVNGFFTSFDYNDYIKDLKAHGFTNIATTWAKTGKSLMEKGGSAALLQGGTGGSGMGVKQPFTYNDIPLSDVEGIFANLVKYSYGSTVTSFEGVKGTAAYAYILDGTTSPYEGQEGMMMEFQSIDAEGMRSDANYCIMTASVVIPFLYNLRTLRGWDGSTVLQQECDALMYVGHEDLTYKLQHGYHSYSRGNGRNDYEYGADDGGWSMYKDIWRRIILGIDEDTTISIDPNEPPPLPPIIEADPKDGETTAPATAIVPGPYAFQFPADTTFSLGNKYTGEVVTEFDLVLSPEIDEDFNAVIAYGASGDTGLTYQQYNVLIQFATGTINVRNGGAYANSEVQFAPNYRFHFRTAINVKDKTYSVWVKQTWPTEGSEVQIADNFAFRAGGIDITNIGSIALTHEAEYGVYWIENHTTNGDALAVKKK